MGLPLPSRITTMVLKTWWVSTPNRAAVSWAAEFLLGQLENGVPDLLGVVRGG